MAASWTLARDLVMVFWAGVASFASPCFLPVVPVFVGYLTGQGARADASRRWFAVGQAAAFMAAFAAVFIALWGLVGLIGWAVGGLRPWLRVAGGVVVVIIGLHTAGLIRVGLLDRMLRVSYAPDALQAPSLRRSLLLGLAFGAGWTPCVGAILAGVLGLAATHDSVGQGVALLGVYSLGLGLPFVLVCAGASTLLARMAWFTRHRRGVNLVIGLFLVGVGFLLIADLFAKLAAIVPAGV